MTFRFRCGCTGTLADSKSGEDVSGVRCSVHRAPIAAAVMPRAPRFVGAVSGPHATTRAVEPAAVTLAAETLKLRPVDGPHGGKHGE
jgi:hypothetical protein